MCGRGAFYYVTMAAVVAVLALSANTSFADFPRLCRVLAEDYYLPGMFAVRGRRLVFRRASSLLAVDLRRRSWSAFGGITDDLIPLFAIGAFLAFTLSQAGHGQHWRSVGGPGARRSLVINAVGTAATGITLVVVAVSKFAEGAWLTVIVVPLLILFFGRVNRHYRTIARQIETIDPLEPPSPARPIVVLAANSWNKMTQQGLKFALRLSPEVYVVQVKTETDNIEDLSDNWDLLIGSRARAAGHSRSPSSSSSRRTYRQFLTPFVDFVQQARDEHPDRDIVVVIPDLVMSRWYEGFLHNNRGAICGRSCACAAALAWSSSTRRTGCATSWLANETASNLPRGPHRGTSRGAAAPRSALGGDRQTPRSRPRAAADSGSRPSR